MKTYRLTKLSDDRFNGFHPNGIDTGYTRVGTYKQPPTVGERFLINGKRLSEHLLTSVVTEILEDGVFKTENSTYKLEEINNDT